MSVQVWWVFDFGDYCLLRDRLYSTPHSPKLQRLSLPKVNLSAVSYLQYSIRHATMGQSVTAVSVESRHRPIHEIEETRVRY